MPMRTINIAVSALITTVAPAAAFAHHHVAESTGVTASAVTTLTFVAALATTLIVRRLRFSRLMPRKNR